VIGGIYGSFGGSEFHGVNFELSVHQENGQSLRGDSYAVKVWMHEITEDLSRAVGVPSDDFFLQTFRLVGQANHYVASSKNINIVIGVHKVLLLVPNLISGTDIVNLADDNVQISVSVKVVP